MGKLDKNGQQKETSMVLDLSDFVKEVDRFSRLIEPFALVFYTVDDIRKWRFRNGTIFLWFICNILCIWLTQAAAFVCASCMVIALATLCLFQIHTRILDKLLPSSKKPVQKSEGDSADGALDTVQNFRYSLIEMHDFVIKSNEYLTQFYSILKWDSPLPSFIYHTEVCMFLICLVMCPARWNCFVLINWFFLCHPHMLKKCYSYVLRTWGQQKAENESSQPSSEQQLQDKVESAGDGKEGDMDLDDADDDSSGSDFDIVGDESLIGLDPSPTKPGMVARLMEIKKRRKQISGESCLSCKVSFSSFLTKRLYCRHCGYSFCNRCCYQMVPRSVFGATSPAAMKETVLVCTSCHTLLVDQGDLASDNTTAGEAQDETNIATH